MALPINRPHNEMVVSAYMADSGTASSVYLAAPCKGFIKRFKSALQGTAVTTADNTFTAFIGSTAITHDAWVQAFTSSAAGDVDEANCTSANFVNEGDMIKVTSDGAGSATTPTMIYAIIEAH